MSRKIFVGTLLFLLMFVTVGFAQEIKIDDEPNIVGINQNVWLYLELPEGTTGKFDDGIRDYKLDINPKHVAANAALFQSSQPGEFRIVAAIVSIDKAISFVEKLIMVKGTGEPPQPDISITQENIQKWLEQVPSEVRKEKFTQPMTGEELTREEAVAQTFTNIGKAGQAIGSVPGLDLMLSTALVSSLGDSADKWQDFANSIEKGLQVMKDNGCSAVEYGNAFILIGESITKGSKE